MRNWSQNCARLLEARPGDVQGHTGSWQKPNRGWAILPVRITAQARVLELKGAEATADEWYAYAELLIMAADTYISREAETALREALRRDPNHKLALVSHGHVFRRDRPARSHLWHLAQIAGGRTRDRPLHAC